MLHGPQVDTQWATPNLRLIPKSYEKKTKQGRTTSICNNSKSAWIHVLFQKKNHVILMKIKL
jgi:hypothetical protein